MFQLNKNSFNVESLPTDKTEIICVSDSLIKSVKNWKKGKKYSFETKKNITLDGNVVEVQTYNTYVDGEYWSCRESCHHVTTDDYMKIVKALNGSEKIPGTQDWVLNDRAKRNELEVDYIDLLKKCNVLGEFKQWVLVNLHYELGASLNTREFNEWVFPIEPYVSEQGEEICMVVSLVSDAPLNIETNTRGLYASVEQLRYNYHTNELIWVMATTTEVGGNIPKWLQNATIAKSIATDVARLLEYLA